MRRPAHHQCLAPFAAALLLAAGLLAAGCSKSKREAKVTPAALPVATVTPEDLETNGRKTRYPVTIARDREADLSFRVGGVLDRFSLRIGDRVTVGEDVARLNATPYQAARVRAEQDVARLSRASARSGQLVPAGAVAPSVDQDNGSALEAARAALRSARYDEASAAIRSPFDGVVLSRQVEVGETVSAAQVIARVADFRSDLIARAAVPQSVARTVHEGEPVQVFTGDGPSLRTTVRHVGAAADPKTGTVQIELTLAENTSLPSGLTASAVFRGADSEADRQGALRLPAEALLDARNGQGHVYVVDRATSTARRVPVVLQGFDGEALRVSGLDRSAQVITFGAGFVRDGQKVAVSRQ